MQNELTIAMVLEHYGFDLTRVRETGWRPVKCNFHQDRTASASVNLALGGFRCHACGVSGDPMKLIMQQEGLDYKDALGFVETVLGAGAGDLRRSIAHEKPKRKSQWRDRLFA